ncbi:MAG: hypothetical protein NTZ87_01015 [Candidatus Nomurabacteria bacterium]|nr:hypothetical protein [Candidatus Nomurabacteria bacterium]
MQRINNQTAINKISCETIKLPTNNSLSFAFLNSVHHFTKNRTT